MQGTVYFGHQSLNTAQWNQAQQIDSNIDDLKKLINEINDSKYGKVTVPHDWFDEICGSIEFWKKLGEICTGDQGLFAYLSQKLYDDALNNCIDKKCSFRTATDNVLNNNPNLESSKFYGVLMGTKAWSKIPVEYHVNSGQSLYHLATHILAQHQIGESNFALLCGNVFSNLEFHSKFVETLKTHGDTSKKSSYTSPSVKGINGFSISVTKVLKVLNGINLEGKSTKEILAEIAASTGFECTPQGSDKEQLRFTFSADKGSANVNCEFHVKINCNNSNDGVYYQDRLYFGFVSRTGKRKIVVAHSGRHL